MPLAGRNLEEQCRACRTKGRRDGIADVRVTLHYTHPKRQAAYDEGYWEGREINDTMVAAGIAGTELAKSGTYTAEELSKLRSAKIRGKYLVGPPGGGPRRGPGR